MLRNERMPEDPADRKDRWNMGEMKLKKLALPGRAEIYRS